MMAFPMILLIVWTGCGLLWWLTAVLLVRRGPKRSEPHGERTDARISIFKPIAGDLDCGEYQAIEKCLESVIADADADCEVLIGANPSEAGRLSNFVERMKEVHPHVRVVLVVEPVELSAVHPKVNWNRKLAEQATGRWWLWSDADMFMPSGTVAALRSGFASGTGMVTSPYVIRRVTDPSDLLDALYVNLEFYPGVLLLGRFDALANGFGAGMLFSADEFREKVSWEFLGSYLADDFELGRCLKPVRLGSTVLETTPTGGSWRVALLHYLRWQKTVRWCQPAGFAAQIVILPLLGWLLALGLAPSMLTMGGLGLVLAADLTASGLICARVGCRLRPRQIPVVFLWSLLRALVWIACWLPWPVVWRGRRWWSPRLYQPAPDESSTRTANG